MKLHSLIVSCALGAASIATAQTPLSPQQPDPSVKKPVPLTATAGEVASQSPRGLGARAGSLEDALKDLENSIKDLEINVANPLPTIVFGPGARELKLAAPLRLKEEVRPLDALALIVAAAGGILEPIYSPVPPGKGEQPSPIGYKIMPATRQTTFTPKTPAAGATRAKDASQSGAVGISLANKDGAIVIEKILPGSPADQKVKPGEQIAAVGEELKGDVYTNNLPIEKVAELIRGTPGSVVRLTLRSTTAGSPDRTVLLKRGIVNYPPPETATPQVGVIESPTTLYYSLLTDSATVPVAPDPSVAPAKTGNAPIVRVYALGSILSGTEDEMKEKEQVFDSLLAEALDRAGLRDNRSAEVRGGKAAALSLSFHIKSKVLIANGTAKEHEIIEQVLKALKENETSSSTQKRP